MRTQRGATITIGFGALGRAALAALLLTGVGGSASALSVALEDGVATLAIDEATGAVSAWTVDGAVHVREQAFYWRVGSAGGESTLAALDLLSSDASDGDGDGDLDSLVLGFRDPGGRFDVEARFALTGSAFGSPVSGAASTLTVDFTLVNTSAGSLDLALFQYTDADLFGSFADDLASFGASNGGSFADGSGLATWEAAWNAAPDSVEASIYGALLASLGDGAATALSGALSAGPGDVTIGVAWLRSLAAGGSFTWSQTQEISVAAVPEPGVALLFAGGLAALAARRRTSMGGNRS
jgi:hypothetical protein